MSARWAFAGRWFPELYALALGAALTADRLLGVPGPESALLLGALVSPALAAWMAARTPPPSSRELVGRALGRAATTAAAGALPLVVHAAFVPFCGGRSALAFFAFGPGIGLPLAALLGAAARLLAKRRGLAIALALGFTLGSIFAGVAEFWLTPGIAIFGEFGGYFPGTFYEPGVVFPEAMFSHRLGSLFLAAALLMFIWTADDERRRLPLAIILGSLALFALVRANGERLGHVATVDRIEEALGERLTGERCTLRLPREVPLATARLHLEECEREVARVAKLLGVSPAPSVSVFYYRSASEKRALMGAGQVDLAKPWRREAHLVLAPYPHPVLPHELVHVVAAEIVPSVFGVPGRLFGLVPNAGLIEGLAVALAWEARMELDPHQAARALLELDMLPPAADVTSLAFIRHPAAVAYAAAGSFLRFVMETHGPEALARVYSSGSIHALDEDLESLERRYQARLLEVGLPEGAVELAATRFSQPSVFHAACPHETATLRRKLDGALGAGDFDAAAESADTLLGIDDRDLAAHVKRVQALALSGREEEAEQAHEALVARGFPAPLLARSLTHLGDARLLAGDGDAARARFERALELPQTEDAARGLELRLYALERGEAALADVRALFVGRDGLPSDAVMIMDLAESLARHEEPAIGHYLAARQLGARDAHEATLERLSRAAPLPSPRFEREAARMRLRALFFSERRDEARALAETLMRDPSTAHEASRYLERLD